MIDIDILTKECPCGKGTYVLTSRYNDNYYNESCEVDIDIKCPMCKQQYVVTQTPSGTLFTDVNTSQVVNGNLLPLLKHSKG